MADYDHDSIESKWQRRWEETGVFRAPDIPSGRKFYCLEMLPYPSGRLHMGHVRNYSIGDAVARYKRMRGYQVLHPMGWDSFGLPAENAAIDRSLQPKDWTESNTDALRGQFKRMGFAYDWSREISTHTPEYYRWNQWFFIQMFRKDLAYRSKRTVNWCPDCATVLANEQVVQGACWRCGTEVNQRDLEQWFFRTSRYAAELLDDLPGLTQWPERVVSMQRNWIGRSRGAFVDFAVDGIAQSPPIRVFTTRIDTIYGATFLALAADHPAVERLLEGSPEAARVRSFVEAQQKAPVGEKLSADRQKEGVFSGRFAVNPFNGEKIPIWIANFVLMEYGTGAIMAVPAHDERDFEFAKQYGLPIRRVIELAEGPQPDLPFTSEDARTVDSGEYSGLACSRAQETMTRMAEDSGFGEGAIQYRLKDWGISRQRYWGTPIPMIHCESCGTVPVPEEDLPILLPEDVRLTGKGGSPLAQSRKFVETTCPSCSRPARRDTDTMDTFVDSSWYLYRYVDPRNSRAPFRKEAARAWFPVDLYIGGIDHAILHLMYVRFFSMVMADLGFENPREPVTRLLCQGMVLKGGTRMQKSKGNVVAPDELIVKYGADVTRLFVLFAAPPEKDLEWSDKGVDGLHRFFKRVWRLVDSHGRSAAGTARCERPSAPAALAMRRLAHRTLARVADDIDRRLHLNTAISAIMELVNALYSFVSTDGAGQAAGDEHAAVLAESLDILAICLAPFAPHLAEEAWSVMGHEDLLAASPWPDPDPDMLVREEVTIVVQVNGKVRGRLPVPQGATEEEVLEAVRGDDRLSSVALPDPDRVRKTVYVPDRLLNIVLSR